ncbi:potassium-transporting ATPase subunit KdpC [Legionella quateirensis]|uniref:Potassium-transporting ATPase KdpC subunit n=1 Tax=Legionella quateirensis TaxID=45072 RepID=A0A378KWM5_9GAMM|nr:potassium-transporting ATPase subunit KdpC [Legionella quateirensis]KTD46256.1 potassium translocating ATPase, subunit C [Legionella quateirensis]STY18975.1 potassium translocating ATPase, subunit C [Legionella quateirensis]
MFKEAVRQIRTAFTLLVLMTVLTGLIYPLLVTGLAQFFFPWQANGSIITQNETPVGSLLIGQSFTSPGYFWGRPSATKPFPYNGAASTGSNSGPSNPNFLLTVKDRVTELKKYDLQQDSLVPVDLVTASGSGLDPDISPLAAMYQIPRIAEARQIPVQILEDLVQKHIQNRTYNLLGEQRVNVLQLNLALDNLRISHGKSTPES